MHKITKVKVYIAVFSSIFLLANITSGPKFNNFLRTKEYEAKMGSFDKYAHNLRVWKGDVEQIKAEFCKE